MELWNINDADQTAIRVLDGTALVGPKYHLLVPALVSNHSM